MLQVLLYTCIYNRTTLLIFNAREGMIYHNKIHIQYVPNASTTHIFAILNFQSMRHKLQMLLEINAILQLP